mgnify:CR=1 FL=1
MAVENEEADPRIESMYRLGRVLGKGSYGVVWKAHERRTDTVVAVKKVFDGKSDRSNI